jgi:hypothetical protein
MGMHQDRSYLSPRSARPGEMSQSSSRPYDRRRRVLELPTLTLSDRI